MTLPYIHGHAPSEHRRLYDQAGTLSGLIHAGIRYPPGSAVLEVGCGAGAQTVLLSRSSPGAIITAVDRSPDALEVARNRLAVDGVVDVRLVEADIDALPFQPATFDHLFVCFVLEHLPRPQKSLAALKSLLKPGGTLTAIEGDHGSTLFHPENVGARRVIAAQVALQRRAGGDATIGRRLHPLLTTAGLVDVAVEPRTVYVDARDPAGRDDFVCSTFSAMMAGIREPAVAAGLTTAPEFDAGVRALRRTAEADGTFCYTFFKGIGTMPG